MEKQQTNSKKSSISSPSKVQDSGDDNQQDDNDEQILSVDEAKELTQIEKKIIIRKITQKYSMDKLMMMLDKKKLEALEEEFSQHPDGIKLANFVWLMKAAINHSEEEKFDLVYGLQKLFAEIDINGDEHMEWGEFTQYIIDAVIQNPSLKGSGQNKNRDLLQETKMMKFKKYFASKAKDKTSHSAWTKSVVWCQKFQALMVLENNQKSIKIIDAQSEDLNTKFLIKLPPQKKDVFILDIDYSNEHSTFGCIDSDCNMIFWDYFINLKICKQIKSPCLQHKIKYLKNHKTWLTMGQDNIIREYDLKRSEPLILQIEGHRKLILDVIELTSPFAIASASLDHTIRIYSLVDKEEISVLSEHTKGVRQLSYNPNFGGFIISVGFERNVYVWSPEVTQKKSLIGRLEGHTEIVVCAKFLNLKPFCVSIDEKYNFRFWDVRTLTCVQVITNEINSQVPIYGIFMFPQSHENERFAVLSKRLLFYDTKKKEGVLQQQNKQEALQDQNIFPNDQVNPIFAEFNKYYLNFSIVTPHDIRIYNAKDGKLQKIIQNIVDPKTKAPITSFCCDDRQRKFYVGDSAGGIRTYNISNGVFIKTVQKPFQKNAPKKFDLVNEMDSHEISALHYLHLENHNVQLLVTSSWDSALQIYDEGEQPDESHLLRLSVGGHGKEDISCMTVCEDLALIATGSISGIIAIWDFESSKIENYCMEHTKQISSLYFMYPLSVLISTCNDGYVCFWGLKQAPLDYRYKLLVKIRNNLEDPDLCYMKVNITCAKTKFLKLYKDSNETTPMMILGDDCGYVNQWDLTKVVQQLRNEMGFKDIQSISKYQLSFNPRKNAQVNSLSASKTQIFFAEQKARKVKPRDSFGFVKKIQWWAHKAQINSITFLENPDGVLTCSADRHVKLWSLDGELWGDINLLKENIDKQWIYPFDWSEKKAKEIEKVKRLMSIVAPPDIQLYTDQTSQDTNNLDQNANNAQKQQEQIEEKVIFEQPPKREKDQREIIDYLAKRQRRMDLEENLKRQHDRQIMLQNQEQMRAQYVTNQMKYSENVYMDKFIQDVQRMTEENYQGQILKNSVINIMDQRFDSLIQASIKGESIKDLIIQSDGLSNNPNGINRQNTGKHNKNLKIDSNYNLVNNNNPLSQTSSRNKKSPLKISYPKPIINRKDKNKEFNQQMLSQIANQNEQISSLVSLTQMDQQARLLQNQSVNDNNINILSPPRSALKNLRGNSFHNSQQYSMSTPNIPTLNSNNGKMVTFDTNQSNNKFAFYDPQQLQQQNRVSTAINYQTQLKPFTPMTQQQSVSNLKEVLNNIKNSISTGNLQDSQMSSLQNIGKQQQNSMQASVGDINGFSRQKFDPVIRPQTSQSIFKPKNSSLQRLMISKSQASLQPNNNLQTPQTNQQRVSTAAMTSNGNGQRMLNSINRQIMKSSQGSSLQVKEITQQQSIINNEDKDVQNAVKSSKLAQTQRRKSSKLLVMASQVSQHANNLEYQIRKDYQLQKDIEVQKQKDQDALSSQNGALSQSNQKTKSNFKRNYSLNNLTSPKQQQRRCIIGFEGNQTNSNSKFLRKLNNFISSSNNLQSLVSDRISNIRYAKGEGMRLLKINYNQVQFDNKILHSQEFGYKKVEPEPHLYNIFRDNIDNSNNDIENIHNDGGVGKDTQKSSPISKQQSFQHK